MRAVTHLGSGWLLAPLCVVGYVWLRRTSHRLARYLPATVAAPSSSARSPSGYLLWTSPIPRVWRWVGTALSVLAVLGVAYSRVYLRAHWTTDVAGGFVGGRAYLLLVLVAVERRPQR